MNVSPSRGLPPRTYLPILLGIAIVFLGLMAYLVRLGFGTSGSVFGSSNGTPAPQASAPANRGSSVSVEGGPPPAVRLQVKQLQARIARNPKDDVALTQMGDMYLASGQYAQAVPYYKRALAANPHNAAAKEGLSQAESALAPGQ